MRAGKFDNDKLEELVLSRIRGFRRPEVLSRSGIGEDCAAVDFSGGIGVFSTDPITAAAENIGLLTVHVSCNDAAAAGAEPIGLLVTLLLPVTASEEEAAHVCDQLSAAAKQAGVEIIGGHTEVTEAVTRIVTSATVVAKAGRNGLISPSGMREGCDIVMTKWAGIEGTAVIAADRKPDFLTPEEQAEAEGLIEHISVVREGLYAAAHGACAMHDVTEGGVLGAVWELCRASCVGAVIDASAVPRLSVTEKICRGYGLDPYRLLSSGSMLIVCGDGRAMADGLAALGVPAAVIGRAGGCDVRLADGTLIAPPEADELYNIEHCDKK